MIHFSLLLTRFSKAIIKDQRKHKWYNISMSRMIHNFKEHPRSRWLLFFISRKCSTNTYCLIKSYLLLITNYFRRNNSVVPINISPRSGNHIEYRASGLILFCEMQRISKAGCWLNKDAGSVCHHSVMRPCTMPPICPFLF